MKKRRKLKFKVFFLLMILVGVIICAFKCIKLNSSYFNEADRCLYVNNNVISFNCPEDYKYIHLKLNNDQGNPIKYNIINPAGKVVKSDELPGDGEFFSTSEKGMWKISFDLNKEINVNYKLWEGNLRFKDPL